MKTALFIALLVLALNAHAQEFYTTYGAGVQHQPNTHGNLYMVRFGETQPDGGAYLEAGIGDTLAWQAPHSNRSYKALLLGGQYELPLAGPVFLNLHGGASMLIRTADGPSSTLSPYAGVWLGARFNGIAVAFGTWSNGRPRLEDEASGRHWGTFTFTGLRFGIDLDIKRHRRT